MFRIESLILKTTLIGLMMLFASSYQMEVAASDKERIVVEASSDVQKNLKKAYKAIRKEKFKKATKIIDKQIASKNNNAHDMALLWQAKTQLAFLQDDMEGVVEGYEHVVLYAEAAPIEIERRAVHGLAMLYSTRDELDKAVVYAKRWEGLVNEPIYNVRDLQIFARLYYEVESYSEALRYVDWVFDVVKQRKQMFNYEGMHQIAAGSFWKLGEHQEAQSHLELLIQNQPRIEYCMMLVTVLAAQSETQDSAFENVRTKADVCSTVDQSLLPDIFEPNKKSANANNVKADTSPEEQKKALAENYMPIRPVSLSSFPDKAWKDKVSGHALVELTVKKDGSVDKKSIKILEAEPKGYFEDIAVKTVRKFKYQPKFIDGKPQRVEGVTYRFKFEFGNSED